MNKELMIQWAPLPLYMIYFAGLSFLFLYELKGIFSKKTCRTLYIYQGLETSMERYLLGIMFIFAISFFYGSRVAGISAAFIVSAGLVLMMQMALYIRANGIRRKGSYEGEKLVTELLREYRINDLNIFSAIEKLVLSGETHRINRKHLKILLYEIRSTGSGEVIRRKTDEFARAVDTNWGRMLAYNIYIAATKGLDVSPALEDILVQLRDAKSSAEERKRQNNETVKMVYVMIPALYAATLFMAANFLDMPFLKFLKNQFTSGAGLMLFYFIVFLFVINMALVNLVLSRKLDY